MRPTKLTVEMKAKAAEYINCYESVIPSVAGLSLYLEVARSAVYNWADKDDEFKDILENILAEQEQKVLSNGLTGDYNATIAKLVLGKHGYTDKQELSGDPERPIAVSQPVVFSDPE